MYPLALSALSLPVESSTDKKKKIFEWNEESRNMGHPGLGSQSKDPEGEMLASAEVMAGGPGARKSRQGSKADEPPPEPLGVPMKRQEEHFH